MLHVLVRENRIDRAFLNDHTIGWAELEPIIVRCSPDWAAPITGIPVGKIEEAATIYGEGPSLLWLGQGLQRQPLLLAAGKARRRAVLCAAGAC